MASAPPRTYAKTFIPIESNPEVFTSLARALGVPAPIACIDIFSLDPAIQPLPPRLYALVLVFPTTPAYEARTHREEAASDLGMTEMAEMTEMPNTPQPPGTSDTSITWFPQTIHNACGTYALIHALSNGPARAHVPAASVLGKIMTETAAGPKRPHEVLEGSDELERAHASAAHAGDTAAPALGDEVGFHYVAFVRSGGKLWELDGDRKGPLVRRNRGQEDEGGDEDEDGAGALVGGDVEFVREYIGSMSEAGGEGFALMGLVCEDEQWET